MTDLQLNSTGKNAQGSPTVIESKTGSIVYYDELLEVIELKNRISIRTEICRFLMKALSFSTVCCFALVFLQGFQAWGFKISESFLRWLCGATIAQIAILLGVFTRAVWEKRNRKPLIPPKVI